MREKEIIASYVGMPHYQVYYWLGLASLLPLRVAKAAWWYRLVPAADMAVDLEQLLEQVKKRVGMAPAWKTTALDQFVGQYRLRLGGEEVDFAIDAHDGKELYAPELLKTCRYYFKANCWSQENYPEKVLPLVNGNGFLRSRHLQQLRALRDVPKTNDLFFVSRIWGGVEHNVRLFEALSSLPCKKRLTAIFVKDAASKEETDRAIRRLQGLGVECTYELLPIKTLWEETSQAKIVMLRAGKYLCIPWRMIDLLCMGACIVTDSVFEPQWPEPLVEGVHYLNGGITRPADTSAAAAEDYQKLVETLGQLLGDQQRIAALQAKSAEYFDNYAAPQKVGEYILKSLGVEQP